MTQEDKALLLKDLCARLPYGVKCSFGVDDAVYEITGINPTCCGASEIQATHVKSSVNGDFRLNSCKPYLFPLSSMTEEQMFDFATVQSENCKGSYPTLSECSAIIDWGYKHHFDVNDLIEKGLALDATGKNIY